MPEELKLCSCKRLPKIEVKFKGTWWYVYCEHCNKKILSIYGYPTKQEAIEAWNARGNNGEL